MSKLLRTINEALSFDEKSGEFTWLERPISHFDSEISARKWNNRFKHKFAGTITLKGYVHIHLLGRRWKAHQLVWLIYHGRIPSEIDHVDGNRSNNRLNNLREVDHAQNMKNQRMHSTNTSGHVGVYLVKYPTGVKWRASILANGVTHNLGTFTTKLEAIEARSAASKRLGFHKNHGARIIPPSTPRGAESKAETDRVTMFTELNPYDQGRLGV